MIEREVPVAESTRIKIICTLGPASLIPAVIEQLDLRRVDLFRINLSHTQLDELEETIALVHRHSSVPICLDTEGAQVRCGRVTSDLLLETGREILLTSELVEGTAEVLTLWPAVAFSTLEPGSRVRVDFFGATLRVLSTTGESARAIVEEPGRISSNKAVTVSPAPDLPSLTDKDISAIALARRCGIEHYALSFASSEEGVAQIRALIHPSARLISKIESRAGVRKMDGIIAGSDAVLIDRGDLSRDVAIEEVPYFQKAIVRRANRWHKPLYVATNLLESMVLNSVPTIAEVSDIANTLLDGAHGLVLAAETAIGVDPVGSVDLVLRAVEAFEREHLGRIVQLDPEEAFGGGVRLASDRARS